jgi:hypothetical protein
MILARVAGDFFQLPLGPGPEDQDEDEPEEPPSG